MNQGFPAIPLPGTGVGSLVSVSDYERITGDTTSSDQDTIDEATIEVAQWCNRTLAYGQYTERLYVDRKGYSYPSATPLDASQATLPGSSQVQGASIWVGYFTPLPDLPVFLGTVRPQTDITYFGGYQAYGMMTGPTPQLPPKLMRAIVKVAWLTLNPSTLSGVPAGATSASLAGVSVSGDLSSFTVGDPDLMRTLKRFTRPSVPAWGN